MCTKHHVATASSSRGQRTQAAIPTKIPIPWSRNKATLAGQRAKKRDAAAHGNRTQALRVLRPRKPTTVPKVDPQTIREVNPLKDMTATSIKATTIEVTLTITTTTTTATTSARVLTAQVVARAQDQLETKSELQFGAASVELSQDSYSSNVFVSANIKF